MSHTLNAAVKLMDPGSPACAGAGKSGMTALRNGGWWASPRSVKSVKSVIWHLCSTPPSCSDRETWVLVNAVLAGGNRDLCALIFTFRQGDRRIIAAMARVVALVHAPQTQSCLEVLRAFIVCGCAIALIAAGRSLPF